MSESLFLHFLRDFSKDLLGTASEFDYIYISILIEGNHEKQKRTFDDTKFFFTVL